MKYFGFLFLILFSCVACTPGAGIVNSGGAVDAEGFAGKIPPPPPDGNRNDTTPTGYRFFLTYGSAGQIVAGVAQELATGIFYSLNASFTTPVAPLAPGAVTSFGNSGHLMISDDRILVASSVNWPGGQVGRPEVACHDGNGLGHGLLFYFVNGYQRRHAIISGTSITFAPTETFQFTGTTTGGRIERRYTRFINNQPWNAIIEGSMGSHDHWGQWPIEQGMVSGPCYFENPSLVIGGD